MHSLQPRPATPPPRLKGTGNINGKYTHTQTQTHVRPILSLPPQMSGRLTGRGGGRSRKIERHPAHGDVHAAVVVHEAQHVVACAPLAVHVLALEVRVEAVVHQELTKGSVLRRAATAPKKTHGGARVRQCYI